jgi:hypothetical protein
VSLSAVIAAKFINIIVQMHKNLALGIAILALSIASTQNAQAATFNLSFSANNFTDGGASIPPDSSVSGTFSYDALDINSPITSLNSVNLTISGYSYTLGELDFTSFGTNSSIGGTNFAPSVGTSTNDFFVSFNHTTQSPSRILYATSGSTGIYFGNFTAFNITPAAATSVPEPFTIIGSLIGGTAAVRMRKKLKSTNKA